MWPSVDINARSPIKKIPSVRDMWTLALSGLTEHGRSMDAGSLSASAFPTTMARVVAQQIGQQLNQYGNGQVDLAFDRHGGLRGRLDWLLPILDNERSVFFTQIGVGNEQRSTLLNMGFGQRLISNDWMAGYNAFFDADVKHGYLRAGVGLEMGYDYFKLSSNGYMPVSSWKQSTDPMLWDVRPTYGYDINMKGYLPLYPQLGGRIKYEQYFGENVGLFTYPNLQKNPHALSLGINYTPIPILTFALDQQIGTANLSQTRVSMKLNIQSGKSWRQQLNPEGVRPMRSLMGSRYDLVDRSSAITLEYKQEFLQVSLPATLAGDTLANIPFNFVLRARYPITAITWSGSAMSACGLVAGCVSNVGGQSMLMLPAYNPTGTNRYQLQANVSDDHGHNVISNVMEVLVNPDPVATPSVSALSAGNKVVVAQQYTPEFMPVTVTGGTAPYRFSISPALPAGLVLNQATGMISGAAMVSAPETTITYTVTITDVDGRATNAQFDMTLKPFPPKLRTTRFQDEGALFSMYLGDSTTRFTPFIAEDGTPPYIYTISPALPSGAILNSSIGEIDPDPPGPQELLDPTMYTITVTDHNGATASKYFLLEVVE
ncbi:MAG: inverse autotransporter beta domain-containing protein [Ottowia sp.]|nr:inverse autotransporter beta domain-containing protein [Ottowia sp.]